MHLRDIIGERGGFPVEAWHSYLERHPELHCPICGRKELRANWKPVQLPYRTTVAGEETGHLCCAVTCEHCAHVLLISACEVEGSLVIGDPGEVHRGYKRRKNSPLRYSDQYRTVPGGPLREPEPDPPR